MNFLFLLLLLILLLILYMHVYAQLHFYNNNNYYYCNFSFCLLFPSLSLFLDLDLIIGHTTFLLHMLVKMPIRGKCPAHTIQSQCLIPSGLPVNAPHHRIVLTISKSIEG